MLGDFLVLVQWSALHPYKAASGLWLTALPPGGVVLGAQRENEVADVVAKSLCVCTLGTE